MIRNTLTYMRAYMGRYVKNQKGQTMVEYALIIALIAIVVAALIPGVTDAIGDLFDKIITELGGTPAA